MRRRVDLDAVAIRFAESPLMARVSGLVNFECAELAHVA